MWRRRRRRHYPHCYQRAYPSVNQHFAVKEFHSSSILCESACIIIWLDFTVLICKHVTKFILEFVGLEFAQILRKYAQDVF